MQGRMKWTAAVAAAALLLAATPTVWAADGPPTGSHDGSLETVAGYGFCYANGWAIDPDHPDIDVLVRIITDGETLTTVLAADFRQDLADAGIGDGTAAFWVDLSAQLSDAQPHSVRVQAQDLDTGTWVDLDGTPRSLTCTELIGFHDTGPGAYQRPDCVVSGWAWDGSAPTTRVQVRVRVDGRIVAEASASNLREDVRDAGFGDGYSGYTVALFGRMTPNRDHLVVVEARDTAAKRIWLPLPGTGQTMRCVG